MYIVPRSVALLPPRLPSSSPSTRNFIHILSPTPVSHCFAFVAPRPRVAPSRSPPALRPSRSVFGLPARCPDTSLTSCLGGFVLLVPIACASQNRYRSRLAAASPDSCVGSPLPAHAGSPPPALIHTHILGTLRPAPPRNPRFHTRLLTRGFHTRPRPHPAQPPFFTHL